MTSAPIALMPASPTSTLDAPARRPMEDTHSGGDGLSTGSVKPPTPPTGPAREPGNPPVLTVSAVVAGEGGGFVDLVFTLSAAATPSASVGWQLSGVGGDLGLTSGSVSFAGGALTQTVRIPIVSDSLQERFESFVVSFANPVQLTLGSTSTLITLVDDDATTGVPVISARDVMVDESAGTANFVVVLDRPSAGAVTVNYATASSTATAGADFTARSGTLSFAAGEVVKTVSVSLADDTLAEAAERFDLLLSAPVGASVGDARGTALIGASDQPLVATPQLRVADQRVSEADGWVDVTVTLSAPSAAVVSVGWATVAGTALPGSDFIASTGTLQFQPGQTTATVRLGLVDNTAAEPLESFSLNLASPANATLADGSAAIAVIDNDTAGVRVLSYGIGSDTYRVLSSTDVIVESVGGGTDLVQSSASYTLGDNVERLSLTGASGLSGTGNGLSNTITGNSGNNLLAGGSGNDTLSGGDGNDMLDGGSGNDSLTGGAGNDRYVVNSSGDKVVEASGGGSDSVSSGITYTLPSHVESLTLTGTSAINGTGNTSSNTITGNSQANSLSGGDGNDSLNGGDGNDTLSGGNGNDLLDGGNGNDSMTGGAGNDRYVVNSSGDKVVEASGGGSDSVSSGITYTLPSHVEKLTLTGSNNVNGAGNTSSNTITGNSKANSLSGGDGNDSLSGADGNDTLSGGNGNDLLSGGTGNDSLNGGAGNDKLTGGAGLDIFRFSSALSATTNVDTLTDFNPADDILQIENSVYTKLAATGVLSASNFRASTTGNAADSNDFVLYDTDSGQLFYDADGSGSGVKVLVATLTGLPVLTAADIFVT